MLKLGLTPILNALGIFVFVSITQAQTMGVLSLGYSSPEPAEAAPGQVITIFISGLGGGVTERVTSSPPLPTDLAGITVSRRQTYTPNGPLAVPISQVFPARPCGANPSCVPAVGITVEIPWELGANIPGAGRLPNIASLKVSDAGGNTASIDLNPVPDAIHILSSSDAMISGIGPGATSVVTHADGALVTPASPAKPGEELVAYAAGLGATNPAAKTGEASSPAATAIVPLAIHYTFAPNAAPSRGQIPLGIRAGIGGPVPAPFPAPLFAGLSPGQAGLFQLNFLVPSPPAGTPACSDTVTSNLTVTFVGETSFDGATICVIP